MTPKSIRNFACRKFQNNIGEALEQAEKLCDEVETAEEFTYFGDRVSQLKMAKRSSGCAPQHFVEPLHAQLLPKQLAIDDTPIYDNLLSPTNIGLASYNHTDSVVVTSNVTEHTENTDIYNSTSICICNQTIQLHLI